MGFLDAIIMRIPGSWKIKDGHEFALGHTAAANLPTCSERRRFAARVIRGGAGTADREVICLKDAADAYDWEDGGTAALDARYVAKAGDTMTGALDVQAALRADSLRLDLAPTAETPTPTHTITISVDGTDYKIPIVAA